MAGDVAIFERHRARLSVAYRMLGEWAAAEDVVQEAWLRWHGVDSGKIRDAGAWLLTVTMRLALDALRAAKTRRETYVVPWLPEPILPEDTRILLADGPAEHAELASDLSLALMHVLERLSPDERAALILHDDYASKNGPIAALFPLTPCACSTRTGARFIGGGGSAKILPRRGLTASATRRLSRSVLLRHSRAVRFHRAFVAERSRDRSLPEPRYPPSPSPAPS